jgi:hypothetical protein
MNIYAEYSMNIFVAACKNKVKILKNQQEKFLNFFKYSMVFVHNQQKQYG